MKPPTPSIHVLLAEYLAKANLCGDAEQARIYHASLKSDPEIWNGLELRGYQSYPENQDRALELRDCSRCGSTLSVKVKRPEE